MDVPVLTVYDDDGNEIPIPAIRGADGAPGATPVKGVDYWTAGDKTEIVSDVLEELYQGADIGLQIVTQLNQPANPADNMIWVETETSMPTGKYMVSSRRPTTGLVNGFLWFREMYLPLVEITLPGSHVSMSVAQVWQYENGAWVWKAGHVYKAADEEWKDTGVYWFKEGTGMNTAVFGAVYIGAPSPTEVTDEYIIIGRQQGTSYPTWVSTETAVPANRYRYLIADMEVTAGAVTLGVSDDYGDSVLTKSQTPHELSRGIVAIDISDVSTAFYPKCNAYPGNFCKIYNLWLV